MAWDDGDKGNPWRPDKDKGAADLDAIVRDLQRKLASFFRGGRGGGGGGGGRAGEPLKGSLIASGALLLLAVWGLTGIYQVDEAERGIVLRFGAFQELTRAGLHWHLPWPIETLEKINYGATERLQYQGSMLTRDENIVNVEVVVQFRRTDPEAFLFNMREPEDAITDATASAIRQIIGKNGLDFILTEGRTDVARQTQDLLQATLDSYGAGVTVYEVNLQDANFPSQVEAAVQDAITAGQDRDRKILEAQAYSNDILPRARGLAERRRQDADAYRAQVTANAEGEGDRFTRILTEYQKSPAVTRERIYIETLEAILSNSTKVIVDTGNANNVLYLPLDQLVQRRTALPANEPSPAVTPPLSGVAPPRSRERETR